MLMYDVLWLSLLSAMKQNRRVEMNICKILNNNAVVCENQENEVIVTGRGVAFNKKVGDVVTEVKNMKCFTLACRNSLGVKYQQVVEQFQIMNMEV